LARQACANTGEGAPRVAGSARAQRDEPGPLASAAGPAGSSGPSQPGGQAADQAASQASGQPGPGPQPARSRPAVPPPPAEPGDDAEQGHADQPAVIDDPEFREYVTARGRALLRTAYLLTGNLADAEDLVQAALAKTYLAWDRIEDRGALDGYVRRAMVNTHISWWRRRRVQEFPTDELPDQAVADHAGDSDLSETLRRAIDRLPHRMRAAVVLRYYEDMTEAEVAERLGVSLGTVKSTVSRAVAKLRIDAELLAD
jgi:RNA polymerase sigma-70 factor (sigma-E family)